MAASRPPASAVRKEPWRKDVPRLNRIVETALYVDDLDRARAFYEDKLGLAPLLRTKTLFAYDVGGSNVLLLFQRRVPEGQRVAIGAHPLAQMRADIGPVVDDPAHRLQRDPGILGHVPDGDILAPARHPDVCPCACPQPG